MSLNSSPYGLEPRPLHVGTSYLLFLTIKTDCHFVTDQEKYKKKKYKPATT